MLKNIKDKLQAFIDSDKDVPILAGFSVGFYMMLFYYSKNFALANSWEQFLFFTGYYIALPIVILFTGYKLLGLFKLSQYRKNYLFVGIVTLFTFYMPHKGALELSLEIIILLVTVIAIVLSLWLKKYYKLFIVLLFLMSVFNVKPIIGVIYKAIIASDEWKKVPDDIEAVKFKQKPNVYYIQPDGYTSFNNLKNNKYYSIDNSDYENFLKENGFNLYENYRSNYLSTLLSNSATFSMKHHYIQRDVDTYGTRAIIVGDNPVLRIFKSNGYKTSFITEKPYLIMNRPTLGYDFCNIKYDEMPYLGDGFGEGVRKDVFVDLKKQMTVNGTSGNFYFVEKFLPGHIPTFNADSEGIEKEGKRHLGRIKESSLWLKEIVRYIVDKDPDAVVIIGADHGGFLGFASTQESLKKVTDKDLIYSIFGAQLAIKWNNDKAADYDRDLKSGVNLFRTVFSFLANDKKYLSNQDNNGSYIQLKQPSGIYKYIDDNGDVVFEKR